MRKAVLRTNSITCLGFGALFVALPSAVQNFVGDPPRWLIPVIGLALIINGAHLIWASLRSTPAFELRYFAAGDLLWVLATAVMITSGVWINTASGVAVATSVALMVGAFGVLQWRIASKQEPSGVAA